VLERARRDREVREGAALLALDDPGVEQLLEVVADRGLLERQQVLEVAHADCLAAGLEEPVEDLHAMAVGERLEDAFELGRLVVAQARLGERRATLDEGEGGHRPTSYRKNLIRSHSIEILQCLMGASAMPNSQLPVAVIGAGPVGLAAAAHLASRGIEPVVFEAGASVGASVREWGHVRVFSPWSFNVDPVAAELLEGTGWSAPAPQGYPTGDEIVERYLEPLAAAPGIAESLHLHASVVSVTRQGVDKLKDDGRDDAPYQLVVEQDGEERRYLARAVIDASGTWTRPNPLGAGGVHASGERTYGDRIAYGIPDVLGGARERYAGRRVLVVGSGHSAFNAILDLVTLRDSHPGTEIVWAIRGAAPERNYGGGSDDQLPARGALGATVRTLVAAGSVEVVAGFHTRRIAAADGRLRIDDGDRRIVADEIIAATGLRPDLDLLRELRLELDDRVEAPRALAPLIDPNLHSCGSVPPHGVDELSHPDAGIYIVGMKSYGRAPTFLLRTGYEQVRSVVAALAGDWESARSVELVLPETGACGGSRDAACCGSDSPLLEIETA
jgi:thioredoxin reductase